MRGYHGDRESPSEEHNSRTYAALRFRSNLDVRLASPCASIRPSCRPINALTAAGCARTLSTAVLNTAVFDSGLTTSSQRIVATPAVRPMPSKTMARFRDCCVPRAAFSRIERSVHGTWPVSDVMVMCLRVGFGLDPALEDVDVVA